MTPETGASLYLYDAAGQMTAMAAGQPAGAACGSLPSSARIAFGYDALGRPVLTDFPDTTPDIALAYDANSNLTRAERGSIIAHTDSAGVRTATLTYDEYGNPGAGNVGAYQYTGQMWLADAGLYHYKNRVYHPGLGVRRAIDPPDRSPLRLTHADRPHRRHGRGEPLCVCRQ